MRPAPPLQVTVARFGAWRCGVLVLMGAVVATLGAWFAALHADAAFAPWPARLAIGIAASAGLVAAATLLVPAPFSLRWDGRQWHLGPAASVGNEPASGRLRVAIDLGSWLLLRFDADTATPRRPTRGRWLPVQSSSVPQAWHTLRCAVYSPRPESGVPSLDSPDFASTRPPFPG